MAFINASVTPFRASTLRVAKSAHTRGVRVVTLSTRRASVSTVAGPRMDLSWEGDYPPSEVLGLGKDVPSFLYLLTSVLAFLLGCYCVAQSNFYNTLSADNVNPQFVAGSLLVPISWGLHVAGWIQMENSK